MISVGSFRMEGFDLLHVVNVATRGISAGITCRVCEFVFIVIRRATSEPIVPFSFSKKCITLHLLHGRCQMDVT